MTCKCQFYQYIMAMTITGLLLMSAQIKLSFKRALRKHRLDNCQDQDCVVTHYYILL